MHLAYRGILKVAGDDSGDDWWEEQRKGMIFN